MSPWNFSIHVASMSLRSSPCGDREEPDAIAGGHVEDVLLLHPWRTAYPPKTRARSGPSCPHCPAIVAAVPTIAEISASTRSIADDLRSLGGAVTSLATMLTSSTTSRLFASDNS